MKEIWIDSKKAAELVGVDRSVMQKRVKAENTKLTYRYVCGCGGRGQRIEILLSSLPDNAIARYYDREPVRNEVEEMAGFSKRQKDEANNKAWVLDLYQHRDKGVTIEEFLEQYNREHGETITKANIFQWQKKFKQGGTAALVDRRGEHKRGTTTIPDEAWDYFYSLYMTQQKRGVQICYDYTKKEYPDIPSVYAFYRKVNTIPEYALIRYRDGEHAFRDVLPSIDRDKSDTASNDIWFSDHHRIDVFTKNEGQSRTCRMWLTVFYDARSNKVISYICRNADPDAAVIKKALKKGMEEYGVPNELYFDNGKDYRSKAFRQDFPLSLVHQIGIRNIYAEPFHGQAKTVERFFGTFISRFCKMMPTYTGKDAKDRPEEMRVSDKKLMTIAPSIEEFLFCLARFIEDYNHTPSKGKDLDGKCPEEVYYQNLSVKREIIDRKALSLLCGTFDTRTVGKNGIRYKNRDYWNEKLLPYFKKKVIINHTSDNMDSLYIFDEDMRAVCTAEAKIRTPFRHTTEEDYKRAEKEKKAARNLVRKYKPTMELDTMSLIAKNQLAEQAQKDAAYSPAAVEPVALDFNTGVFEAKRSPRDADPDIPDIQSVLLDRYLEEEKKRKIGGY